jgi:phage terminase small subunit
MATNPSAKKPRKPKVQPTREQIQRSKEALARRHGGPARVSYDPDSPKAIRFCLEFLIDANATAAAERAGYRSPSQAGWDLMQLPSVRLRILELMKEREDRTKLTADRALEELTYLSLVDVGDLFDEKGRLLAVKAIPEHARRAIKSVKVKRTIEGRGEDAEAVEVVEIAFVDKNVALTNALKHHGLLNDKLEISGTDTLEDLVTKSWETGGV